MDESWRMVMGARRRSTEQTAHHVFDLTFSNTSISDSETLHAEDFNDVFGGPPLTVLSRNTSATEFNVSELFRSPDKKGKNLSVPVMDSGGKRRGVSTRSEGFYDDIFGSDHEDGKSRSKVSLRSKSITTKSNSSSVLSSEDLSPLRPSVSDDLFFSSYSSKLRPINIPLQRKSPTMVIDEHKNIQGNVQGKSDTPQWHQPPVTKTYSTENNLNKHYNLSPFKISQSGSSPEIISIEPTSYRSIKPSIEDIEIDSPSSMVSSLWNRVPDDKVTFQDKALLEEEEEDDEDDDEDEEEEIMSSYVIEISCEKNKNKSDESMIAIDEAVAWAKEKFQTESVETIQSGARIQKASPSATKPFPERKGGFVTRENCYQLRDGHERLQFLMVNEKLRNWITEEKQQ